MSKQLDLSITKVVPAMDYTNFNKLSANSCGMGILARPLKCILINRQGCLFHKRKNNTPQYTCIKECEEKYEMIHPVWIFA
ncbi:hypothetical protein NIES2101_03350 [Calothrix sp. HK-06]|nr:hypothetical protein NIES2101_03350 [Calothrix sp. HK-06]